MFEHDVSTDKSTTVRMVLFRFFNAMLSRLAPALAARLAERLFVSPMSTPRPERETAWEQGARRMTLASAMGPIPVWVWGDGAETVLLAHGWSGRGLQLGAFVEPLVARGFRVVAHDAPGHGEARGVRTSLPAFAAALGAVGRRFGPVAAVLGHSMGSTAAIYALAQCELRAERLVVISPSARLDEVRRRFGELTGFSPDVVERLRAGLERRFGFEWESAEPLRVAPAMETPCLVIHDADDRFIPHDEGRDLAQAWPGAALVTTRGLGHHRILRDPDVVSSAVAFLDEAKADPLERRAS